MSDDAAHEGKRTRYVFARVDEETIDRIEQYRGDRPYMTRSIAVRELLDRALSDAERRRSAKKNKPQ